MVTPDRDVRPFQDVLIDLGARLGLPGMTKEDGTPKFPGGYPDYIVNHERRPGIGPLAGHRGSNGGDFGKGDVNPRQLEQYIADGCFHVHHLPAHMRYFRHVNRDYIDWAVDKGFRLTPTPVIFQLYSEPMQTIASRRPRPRRHRTAAASTATASRPISIRCPSGTRPSTKTPPGKQSFPCTPSPKGRWRCITAGARRTRGCARSTGTIAST